MLVTLTLAHARPQVSLLFTSVIIKSTPTFIADAVIYEASLGSTDLSFYVYFINVEVTILAQIVVEPRPTILHLVILYFVLFVALHCRASSVGDLEQGRQVLEFKGLVLTFMIGRVGLTLG